MISTVMSQMETQHKNKNKNRKSLNRNCNLKKKTKNKKTKTKKKKFGKCKCTHLTSELLTFQEHAYVEHYFNVTLSVHIAPGFLA